MPIDLFQNVLQSVSAWIHGVPLLDFFLALNTRDFTHLSLSIVFLALFVSVLFVLRMRSDLVFSGVLTPLGLLFFLLGSYHAFGFFGVSTVFEMFEEGETVFVLINLAAALLSALTVWGALIRLGGLPDQDEALESHHLIKNLERLYHRTRDSFQKSRDSWEATIQKRTIELEGLERSRVEADLRNGDLEKKLAVSVSAHQAVMRGNPALVLLIDRKGVIQGHSPLAAHIQDAQDLSLVGRSCWDLVDSSDRHRLRTEVLRTPAGKRSEPIEIPIHIGAENARLFEILISNHLGDPGINSVIVFASDISERKRKERVIKGLYLVASSISDSSGFYEGIENALRGIGHLLEAQFAEVWVTKPDGSELLPADIWYGGGPGLKADRPELIFESGKGLLGKVWSDKKLVWLESLDQLDFPDKELTEQSKFKSGVAAPVLHSKNEVLAVLVFFTKDKRILDPEISSAIMTIMTMLSSLFQKKLSEETLRKRFERKELELRGELDEMHQLHEGLQHQISELSFQSKKLIIENQKFRRLLHLLPGIFWEYEPQHNRYSFVSAHSYQLLGYPAQSWIEDAGFWISHVHGLDREQASRFRQDSAKGKGDGTCEYRMVTRDGRAVWVREKMHIVSAADSDQCTWAGVLIDISEHKQKQQAVEREQKIAGAVLQISNQLIMVLDPSARILRFNPTCEVMTGYVESDVIGKTIWELFVMEEEEPTLKAIFSRLLAGQFPEAFECSWKTKTDGFRTLEWTMTLLYQNHDIPSSVVASGFVVKNREIEKRLLKSVSQLEGDEQKREESSHEMILPND